MLRGRVVRVGWICRCQCAVVDRKQEGRTFDRDILNENLNVEAENYPKHQ